LNDEDTTISTIEEILINNLKNKTSFDSNDTNNSTISEISFNHEEISDECKSMEMDCIYDILSSPSSNKDRSEEIIANSKQPIINVLSYDVEDLALDRLFETAYTKNSKTYYDHLKEKMSCNEIFSPMPNLTTEDIDLSAPLSEATKRMMISPFYMPFKVKKVKREIIDLSGRRFTGMLKFYNENKGFGFVGCEQDDSEIFLHGDDLLKANIDIKILKKNCMNGLIRFSFSILDYMGKYNRSRKIVDLKLIEFS